MITFESKSTRFNRKRLSVPHVHQLCFSMMAALMESFFGVDRLRRTSLRLIESSLIVLPTYNSQSFGTPKLPLCLTSSLADTRIRCEQYHESSQDSKTFRTGRFFAFLPAAFPSSTDLSMRAVNRVMEVVSQIGQRFKVDPTEIKKVRLSSPSHLLQESILTG